MVKRRYFYRVRIHYPTYTCCHHGTLEYVSWRPAPQHVLGKIDQYMMGKLLNTQEAKEVEVLAFNRI
jgi:hypothetical protein